MLNDTRTVASPSAASARDRAPSPLSPPVAGNPIKRRHGRPPNWSHADTLRLLELRERGLRNYEIAREMGRSECVISNNIFRLRSAGVTIPKLPTGQPKGTTVAAQWYPPTRSKSDFESRALVQMRANRLAAYWHGRGFGGVKFWLERTGEVNGHPIFEIRSNLINGHPPVSR